MQILESGREISRAKDHGIRYVDSSDDRGYQLGRSKTKTPRVADNDHTGQRLLSASANGEPQSGLSVSWSGEGPFDNESEARFDIEKLESILHRRHILLCDPPSIIGGHGAWMSARAMIHAAIRFGHKHDIEVYLIECAPDQVAFYEWLGFRSYTEPRRSDLTNLRLPMALVISDRQHLRRIRSPLLGCALARRTSTASPQLLDLVKGQGTVSTAPRNPRDPHWVDLLRLVRNIDSNGHGLFASLTGGELQSLLRHSLIMNCHQNQKLISSGDPKPHVLLVLSGRLAVKAGNRTTRTILAGDLYGVEELHSQGTPSFDVVSATGNVSILLLDVRAVRKNKAWLRASLGCDPNLRLADIA